MRVYGGTEHEVLWVSPYKREGSEKLKKGWGHCGIIIRLTQEWEIRVSQMASPEFLAITVIGVIDSKHLPLSRFEMRESVAREVSRQFPASIYTCFVQDQDRSAIYKKE